jgi:predicted aconitase with swiveling domain
MELRGRTINGGDVESEAVVLETPFNFTTDFDPRTGTLGVKGHPLYGKKIGNKILVIPGAKGAVTAAITIYHAKKMENAPAAILCRKADPITVECAMVIDIPMMDSFDKDVIEVIKTGDRVKVFGEKGVIEIERALRN